MQKSLYYLIEEDEKDCTRLLLTKEQAAVFFWLTDKGYTFHLKKDIDKSLEEINPDTWKILL